MNAISDAIDIDEHLFQFEKSLLNAEVPVTCSGLPRKLVFPTLNRIKVDDKTD